MGSVRSFGGGVGSKIKLREVLDPQSVADSGWIYTNDVGGRTELMYQDDTGAEIQITKTGNLNPAAMDHGGLAGLADDDHTQYALLAGRLDGQVLVGGTVTGNGLTYRATSTGTGPHIWQVGPGGSDEAMRILATKELLVGRTTLFAAADIANFEKSQNATTFLRASNPTNGTAARTSLGAHQIGAGNDVSAVIRANAPGFTTNGAEVAGAAHFLGDGVNLTQVNVGSTFAVPLTFWTNNVERARFISSGELGIGGTPASNHMVSMQRNLNALIVATLSNTTSGTVAASVWNQIGGATNIALYAFSEGYTTTAANVQNSAALRVGTTGATNPSFYYQVVGTGSHIFQVDANTSPKTALTISLVGGAARSTFSQTGDLSGFVIFQPAALTGMTALEKVHIAFEGETQQFTSGALIATQRAIRMEATTYTATAATQTITDAATLAIVGAPIAGLNVAITNAYAMWVQAGATRLDGNLGLGVAPATRLHTFDVTTVEARWQRDQGTPANADLLTRHAFYGDDSAGVATEYARIDALAKVVTDASEEGQVKIVVRNGAAMEEMVFDPNGINLQANNHDLLLKNGRGVVIRNSLNTANVFVVSMTGANTDLVAEAGGEVRFFDGSTQNGAFLGTGEFLVGRTTLVVAADIAEFEKNQNNESYVRVLNGTSGSAARSGLMAQTSGAGNVVAAELAAVSNSFASSGIYVAGAAVLRAHGANITQFNIGTHTATGNIPVAFFTEGVERSRFLGTGEALFGYTTLTGTEIAGFRKDQNANTYTVTMTATDGTVARGTIVVSAGGVPGTGTSGGISASAPTFTPSGGFIADAMHLYADASAGAGIKIMTAVNGAPIILAAGNNNEVIRCADSAGTKQLAFFAVTPVSQATALTAKDGGVVNSGDATTDGVINNNRTRIEELETKLKNYGLLPA